VKNRFLIGKNVYLRGLSKEDLEGNYITWLNDGEVCAYSSHHVFPYSKESAETYIKSTSDSRAALVLAMVLKENDLHIGNIALQNIDYINRSAEFAILLGEKDYWGRGYSKEAAIMLVKHGFTELNLHRIYCGTTTENIAMKKLATSLGMVEEGRRRNASFKRGRYIDIIEYGLLKAELLTS